ncbi:transcriptional regulator [Streptomyces chrestomyceticus JCM 4735]|uniref:Transcriptional regulator n=1 Tax=Streptomyces chrestomyceticus JCM 4735 TaxID=1306181 RepID=A0A7U9KTU8_9ACTN|nr:IclR family transcriptional regulator C-terminal domain-containing protein [Streptomyces chrestomyceticus]GCD35269.1 transcriptional regulator [Streptomyces chrestomyceticus JCM 4735]
MPQSVDRALDLLDAVAAAAEPVTAKALARQLDCGLSTVYDLLGSLTERGHLARTAAGYTLGYRVPALHQAFQRQLRVDERVHEVLLRLRRSSGADVFFSTYRDGEIAVLDGAAGPESAFSVGQDTAAHATAHGRALLAALPAATRRQYLAAGGMRARTARTITTPDRLERELRRVRRDGIAVEREEAASGMACVAVPVPLRPGGPGTPTTLTAVSAALPVEDFARLRAPLTEALRREVAALA